MSKRVLYVQYTNPGSYPPLEHSSRILADGGYDITFLGTKSFASSALKFRDHERIVIHRMSYAPKGVLQKLHYLRYFFWVIGWALWNRPDLVYCSDSLSCPAGLILKVLGRHVVYHEHDAPANPMTRFQRIIQWTRLRLMRTCLVIVPSEGRRRVVEAEGAGHVEQVWNCPSLSEMLPAHKKPPADPLRLLYQGSVVPNRLPKALVQAMASPAIRGRVKLTIVGYETIGSKGFAQSLVDYSQKLGNPGAIEYLGTIPERSDMLELGKKHHVGISFVPKNAEDLNLRTMAGASNKPFDYMSQGMVLIFTSDPDWCALYDDFGLAVDPDDPDSIRSALARLIDEDGLHHKITDAGYQRIRESWHYEAQFEKILPLLGVKMELETLPETA